MYERYGPAAWDTHPAAPEGPSTDPDPEACRVRPTVKCLVVRDGRALCIRWSNGDWSLPGGGVEPDESVYAAAEREVREETGLDVRAIAVLDCYSYFLGRPDGVQRNLTTVLRCEERQRRAVDTDANPVEIEEITAHEWVPLDAVGDRVVGEALGASLGDDPAN